MSAVHPQRANNRNRVLAALMETGGAIRPQLARRLDLSLMAITRIVNELVDAGLVEIGGRNVRAEPGRRPSELTINPSGAYLLGFELHAFRQSMVLMDLSRRVVRSKVLQLSVPRDGSKSLTEISKQAKQEIKSARIDPRRVVGAGVAITGIIDRANGVLVDAPYLGWSSLDIADLLQARLDLPVVVDRIANALLASEAQDRPAALRNAMLVNVGFAMSAAFLLDGTIARGNRLMAGHIGHMASDDKTHACSCGQMGCLNVAASGWRALADLGQLEEQVISAEEFQRDRPKLAALMLHEERGDPRACEAVERIGRALGRALRQLQIALDPEMIFLSGVVGRSQSYVEGVRQGIGSEHADLVVRSAHAIEEAAALIAIDEFVRTPLMDFERLRQTRPAGSKPRATALLRS